MENKNKTVAFFVLSGAIFLFLFAAGAAGAEENPPVLTLQEGVRLTAENNPTVKAARLEEEAFSKDVVVARSRLLPTVEAEASVNNLENQPGSNFGSLRVNTAQRSYNSYGVSLNQLIFDSGASGSVYRAAQNSREVKRLAAVSAKNSTVLHFILAYFDLLEAEKILQVSEKEVEQLEAHRKTAQDLYDQGVITKNDLLQAKVRLADSRQRMLTVRNLKEISEARINNLISRRPQEKFRTAEPPDISLAAPELAGAWQEAEERRPELKALERQTENAALQVKVKRAGFWPKVFLRAGYSYTENRYQVYDDNWFTSLNFGVDIFNGGATAAEAAKAGKQREMLVEEAKRAGDDIRLEVEKYFLEFNNAGEKLAVAGDAVVQAEENLKINKTRYEEGTGTATDVLDAITILTAAETNRYRASYDLKRAYAGLLYAVGRDLSAEYGN